MLLPSEYQQVEYIQTSGTQFIDTGITPQSNIQIETKVSVVTTSQNLPVFGNYVDNSAFYTSGEYYHLTCYSSKWYWGLNGSESNGGTYSTTVGTQYEIIYNNSDNQVLVNGSSLGSSSGTAGYTGTTLAISVRGNNYTNNKFYGQYKYYYFNVFNKTTGEYERQMIPCYRKSDGVIGMYDLVNSVFYTNDGTGTFTKGADINGYKIKRILTWVNNEEKQIYPASRLPSAYQEVEWIETTGTQFINTGLFPGNNIQTETKIELTTTDQNIPVFGGYTTGNVAGMSTHYHLTPYGNSWYFGLNGSESHGGTYNPVVGTQYTIVYNNSNNYLNVDGTNIVSVSGTTGVSGSILAISRRGTDVRDIYIGKYKYFYFKMYNKTTGEYVRDFVPCYRKSDNVIGMYDLVNDQFYTNAGTGTFNKGSDVN